MVAISLYRGNLHRVPDVPRQWLMPTPKISLKDFKILLDRRSRALSRLRSVATTSNPNPSLKQEEGATAHEDNPNGEPQLDLPKVVDHDEEVKDEALKVVDQLEKLHDVDGVKDWHGFKGDDCAVKPADELEGLEDAKPILPENVSNPVETPDILEEEKLEAPVNPNSETCKVDETTDKEKRKREVEEKLQILNERKHNLVQLLKQILNAEEELRRRSSMQGMAVRPSFPLQVDVTNDSGSMSRQVTPRLASDGNIIGDMEGADADDGSNQNMHSRNLLRMSSMSPSSDSPHRRPFSAVPHPSRATLGVGSSPSRFAPTGQQGNPPNLQTVSVSGTNYVASSPSPAGSGGTSAFRDARLPSPWN